MTDKQYSETAKAIIEMVEGMTHSQWNKINHLIEVSFQAQEAKLTFEKDLGCYWKKQRKK